MVISCYSILNISLLEVSQSCFHYHCLKKFAMAFKLSQYTKFYYVCTHPVASTYLCAVPFEESFKWALAGLCILAWAELLSVVARDPQKCHKSRNKTL